MALNHSPKIVTDGLVFAYDMANTQKSFKGAPTTNYVTNALAMTGWNNYSNGTPVAITTSLGTPGYGFYNAGSWNGIYRSVTIPSTGTYTFSAWVRYIGGSANNNGGGVYISGWGGGDTASTTNRTLPGQWQRLSVTLNCTNTTFTFYLISWGGTNGADNSSWEMTMPQAEPGSFATSFVDGTRSNTQALVDLTGTNTITATSLTYAGDGTFSFNGSTNYITTSNTGITHGTSNFSYSCWAYWSGKPTYGTFFENGSWTNSLLIRYETDGITIYSMGTYYGKFAFNPTLSIWYHMFFVRNGNNIELYVNGVYHSSVAFGTSLNIIPNTSLIYIGMSQHSAGQCFNGKISNASIYNRALTAAEVKQNFNALRGRYGI